MKNLQHINKIFFIGIGGIGMSALARYFHNRKAEVWGYDRTASELTEALVSEGIKVTYNDNENEAIKNVDMVVYTPAIPHDNKILQWYKTNGFELYKRADVLGMITENYNTIAVAGSHGKTTTSTLIAHIFRQSSLGCTAFLGGIASNYLTNHWSNDNSKIAVVEGDEYDRSFLKLTPQTAVVTAMDPDHLDIYGTVAACEEAFIDFVHKIKQDGTLIYKKEIKRAQDLQAANKLSYSLQNDLADAYAANIKISEGGYFMDVFGKDWLLQRVYLPLGGMHNVENCVAAISVAKLYDITDQEIIQAISNFKGIKRRFEYVYKRNDWVYIDDYAHHPQELEALIKSIKTLFPKYPCIIAFQPHLYTRTRDFGDEFAQVLSLADEVLLLDIYPARETPIPGVNAQMIAEKMGNPNVTVISKEGLLKYVETAKPKLFITAGAGDIGNLVPDIKNIFERNDKA